MRTLFYKRKAFTLIEALVSCVILAGALMALFALSSQCLNRVRLNQQYDLAAQLLDRQLTAIDYMGIDQFIELGKTSGQIEESDMTYYWQASIASENIDNLYTVTMTISWLHRNKPQTFTFVTRFNGQPLTLAAL